MLEFFRSDETGQSKLMDSREKILDVATRLFTTQGYGLTSISHVARAANVSKALIFWHFESKEKLFQAALERSLEPYFINVVDQLEDLDETAQVLRLVDMYADFVRENLESVRFVLSVILRQEKRPGDTVSRLGQLFSLYGDLLADVLEKGRQSGAFSPDIRPKEEAALVRAALSGALVQQFLDEDTQQEALLVHLKTTLVERLRPKRQAS